jgi:hypothetical protein
VLICVPLKIQVRQSNVITVIHILTHMLATDGDGDEVSGGGNGHVEEGNGELEETRDQDGGLEEQNE